MLYTFIYNNKAVFIVVDFGWFMRLRQDGKFHVWTVASLQRKKADWALNYDVQPVSYSNTCQVTNKCTNLRYCIFKIVAVPENVVSLIISHPHFLRFHVETKDFCFGYLKKLLKVNCISVLWFLYFLHACVRVYVYDSVCIWANVNVSVLRVSNISGDTGHRLVW